MVQSHGGEGDMGKVGLPGGRCVGCSLVDQTDVFGGRVRMQASEGYWVLETVRV